MAARLREEDLRGFDFTYLSKIENDRLPPPSAAAIVALAEELDANADELLALAEKAPADLGEAMKKSEGARTFFRSAVNENLSEEEWNRLLDTLKRMKKGRGDEVLSQRRDRATSRAEDRRTGVVPGQAC